MTRSLTILGATGSIGASTLDLVKREPDRFDVLSVTANRDAAGLAAAARSVKAKRAVICDPAQHDALAAALAGTGIATASGADAVTAAAGEGADVVVAGIVGCAGLAPVAAAVEAGGCVILANKEPLVSAGTFILDLARKSGATLLPADSEHNAIFQVFDFERPERVRRIVLTASGGPFRDFSINAMRQVTPEQACAHPNWSMGAKISVDSATMMNKGLELIEAARLFPINPDRIEIVVHRQSVVHSLVDYIDGSMLAQLGPPDMRTPLAYCLAWPDRMATPMPPLDLAAIGRLDFEAIDEQRFPATRVAREALAAGGAAPCILNAANEVAVAGFLAGQIGFLDIVTTVERTLERYQPNAAPQSVSDVLSIDAAARAVATEAMLREEA
ncbi:1-deoxy-D-xylulose 5-phosphate reductoisomerase [Sphingomonas antarctica]|uniref:1-deoxy-D-xylulose-5-phosphate reductoisomerase n=1 Tax=Sphingomonas antarctica TaxID=2040274 RepID=UPI0039E8309C